MSAISQPLELSNTNTEKSARTLLAEAQQVALVSGDLTDLLFDQCVNFDSDDKEAARHVGKMISLSTVLARYQGELINMLEKVENMLPLDPEALKIIEHVRSDGRATL